MTSSSSPVVAIIQARMSSTRLPEKVLKPLAGEPLILRVTERAQRIEGVDRVVVALAEGQHNDPVVPVLEKAGVEIVRGSEEDVLSRTADAARAFGATTVMRITSDCPLIDPQVSASVLAAYNSSRNGGIAYARTCANSGYPHGFDTEVVDAQALFEAEKCASAADEREHVTPYIRNRANEFPSIEINASPDRRHWRLTVDTEDDYRLVSEIYEELHSIDVNFGYPEICRLFERRPDLVKINSDRRAP